LKIAHWHGTFPEVFRRAIERRVRDALTDTPIVLIVGPRQVGKSTFVQRVLGDDFQYVTMDDFGPRSAAAADPAGFLAGYEGPLAIDEVQKEPGLLDAIKASVDRDRSPGRFLLTGSTNVLTLPKVAESLAGRMEIVELHPLSQREISGSLQHPSIVERIFEGSLPKRATGSSSWRERALRGGFPEVRERQRADRRAAWFESYLASVLARDVRDVANIDGLATLPRLLRLLAARSAGLMNAASIARAMETPLTTVKRHLAILETLFFVRMLPAWHANLGRRLVKSPKVYVADSGLLAHLLGLDSDPSDGDGALLETFVVQQILAQLAESPSPARAYHFRTHAGDEVDLVLEDARGRLVGIEIKATQSPTSRDLRGLRALREGTSEKFVRGVLLYGGSETVAFGSDLHAVPLAALW
jgi:uncharacterized protein